ncbi:MAG: DUF5996 family protein [Pseudomonadota bacterium]
MNNWPDIPYTRWKPTGESLHMWLQIVGKFRLALTPWLNHSWHATFYVSPKGLTTGSIPGPDASYRAEFDFLNHCLHLESSDGRSESFPLKEMTVAEFHSQFVDALGKIGAPQKFNGSPNEVQDAIPFIRQTQPGHYNPSAAADFWRALVSIERVFSKFRTGFLGKSSPVHLFWGSFDLAVTRFSGQLAPPHPGGIPNLPDPVSIEAYSHEVSSAGFWPGGGGVDEACFYSYAYPVAEEFSNAQMSVDGAYFNEALGEYLLPYSFVKNAKDPETTLMTFLQETYAAAANSANWNRDALECPIGQPAVPRT